MGFSHFVELDHAPSRSVLRSMLLRRAGGVVRGVGSGDGCSVLVLPMARCSGHVDGDGDDSGDMVVDVDIDDAYMSMVEVHVSTSSLQQRMCCVAGSCTALEVDDRIDECDVDGSSAVPMPRVVHVSLCLRDSSSPSPTSSPSKPSLLLSPDTIGGASRYVLRGVGGAVGGKRRNESDILCLTGSEWWSSNGDESMSMSCVSPLVAQQLGWLLHKTRDALDVLETEAESRSSVDRSRALVLSVEEQRAVASATCPSMLCDGSFSSSS